METTKRLTEFAMGGLVYGLMEISWRGETHISMFIAGGICFCLISYAARKLSHMGLILQCLLCSVMITSVEFAVGVIVNLWMGLNVWDYSGMEGNILGQVCPQFTALWWVISGAAIYLRSYIGSRIFAEVPYPIRILPITAGKTAEN